MKKLSMFLVLFGTLLTGGEAEAARVVKLGQTLLNYRSDLDFIHVPNPCWGPGNKRIEKVMLRVSRNAAEIDYLAVRYGNGVIDRLPVREHFAQGSTSRWIDLRGGERCVKAIAILGDTETAGPKALVEVFGLDY